jgi:hypothetical protein
MPIFAVLGSGVRNLDKSYFSFPFLGGDCGGSVQSTPFTIERHTTKTIASFSLRQIFDAALCHREFFSPPKF